MNASALLVINVRYQEKDRLSVNVMAKGCTLCGATYHTKTFCFKNPKQRKLKPIIPLHCTHCDKLGHTRKDCVTLKLHKLENDATRLNQKTGRYPDVKPIKKSGKYGQKWLYTRRLWIAHNPPNHSGYYQCHYCTTLIPRAEMTLDHKESRSRRPDLRYELSNLVPCCAADNERKGSRSHDEYTHSCSI